MTEYTVGQITAAYIRLREIKAEISKRHEAELEPVNTQMSKMENWLLNQMNEQGVDSFKTPVGTPYKKVQTSTKMEDPQAFKDYIMKPAIEGIIGHIQSMGYIVSAAIAAQLKLVFDHSIRWDLADLRVSKSGVQDYIEQTQSPPPGVAITTFATVNIRRT